MTVDEPDHDLLPSWVGEEPVLEDWTFGQGSYGVRCRLCCADDYDGELVHHPECPAVTAEDER